MTSDLITRLEQAEAGSRELDHDIAHALFDNVTPAMRVYHGDGWIHPEYGKVRCEPYTSSLDAIVALIGEKLPGWVKGYQDDPDGARAILANPQTHYAMWSTAKTPATAFCIALLRAIKEGEHG